MKSKEENAITLVALIVTIIILLVLAGIAISTLGGENGLFARVKQAKKAHVQSEMQEQLTLALNSLQIDKNGSASLDDVTQEWISSVISSDYNPTIKEDASLDGKMVVMNKNDITGRFIVNQKLEISKTEFDISTLEFEYETEKIENEKVKILIKITDKVNGLKRVDYPEASKDSIIMENRKIPLGIDYYVELGKEYKFVITTGDGNKTEKTIKIDDYYYNVTKTLAENAVIDNNATKAAYNKTYEATVSTEGNYAITGITVTMGGQTVTTSGNNVVDVNTGKIKIEKVTGDIDIKVTTKELKIQCTAAVSKSNSSTATSSEEANTIEKGKPLYINIIATLEGNKCTVVLKSDNTKTVPYAVNSNGKYTFKVSGTYNGKTVEEEKEVIVNQYMSAKGVVQYDAGNWTKEEIEELQHQNLYMINKEKELNETLNLNYKSGLNFTFGGFTYEGDIANESDISNGNIIISRNQSVGNKYGTPKYSGWQLLKAGTKQDESENTIKNEDGSNRIYVEKIIHAGCSENFVYSFNTYYPSDLDLGYKAEYLLSGGKRQKEYSKLKDGEKAINVRNWQMYVDQKQKNLIENTIDKDGNIIKDVHMETINEETDENKKIGCNYWTANGYRNYYSSSGRYRTGLYSINEDGENIYDNISGCNGIRVVVQMTDGVYIKAGTGTDADPYILGKDE